MKRDWDVFRKILIAISNSSFVIKGVRCDSDRFEVDRHFELLIEDGFC